MIHDSLHVLVCPRALSERDLQIADLHRCLLQCGQPPQDIAHGSSEQPSDHFILHLLFGAVVSVVCSLVPGGMRSSELCCSTITALASRTNILRRGAITGKHSSSRLPDWQVYPLISKIPSNCPKKTGSSS
jgi:hypothetical protein